MGLGISRDMQIQKAEGLQHIFAAFCFSALMRTLIRLPREPEKCRITQKRQARRCFGNSRRSLIYLIHAAANQQNRSALQNRRQSGFAVSLRQYRTKIVPQMRCQIFRQIVQKFRRHTDVCRGIFVQDDGKYASRCGAKPQGGLCAVLP